MSGIDNFLEWVEATAHGNSTGDAWTHEGGQDAYRDKVSFKDKSTGKEIGRYHDMDEAKKALESARRAGKTVEIVKMPGKGRK